MSPAGPLAGIRVLDLTRVLAGPTCTQLFGDLGADVIKVEQPARGDDTRSWGPPYLKDRNGNETDESAYYLSTNRNKRSVTIDFSKRAGQELIHNLLARSDVLIENFKVGGLAKYGLDYAQLAPAYPELIHCSITGFGQTGPYAPRPGYDVLIQAMGGIMSVTGEPDGEPMKVAVGIADVMCGMYASSAILAALHHRTHTGSGQYIDLALFDTQIAWLINEGLNYLTSGNQPVRRGNAHPNVVPYQAFATRDGHVILAVGNDGQFARFCAFSGADALAADPRFQTNAMRVRHRDDLIPQVAALMARHDSAHWLEGLAAVNVPCGPINTIDRVFADPQAQHRDMSISMPHALAADGVVRLIGNPIKFSGTPVSYRRPPPLLGEHTEQVLADELGLDATAIADLRRQSVI